MRNKIKNIISNIKGKSADTYIYDQSEFNSIKWFSFDTITYEKSDPYMRRFIGKFRAIL